MKNFPHPKKMNQLLDEVVSLLDEGRLHMEIDAPLDSAAASFTFINENVECFDNDSFLNALGKFMAHVYKHDAPVTQKLTPYQAQAEGVSLLENAYRGPNEWGYEGALRDVVKYGNEGLTMVFSSIIEAMKAQRRNHYLRWVLATRIEMKGRQTRRALTAAVLERWGKYMGEEVVVRSLEELMPACEKIILDYIGSEESLRQVFGRVS
jgi:hypothetical protein